MFHELKIQWNNEDAWQFFVCNLDNHFELQRYLDYKPFLDLCVCVIDLDVAFAMDHASFFRMLFPGMTIDVSEIKDPDLVAIWHALPLGGEGLKSVQSSADQSSWFQGSFTAATWNWSASWLHHCFHVTMSMVSLYSTRHLAQQNLKTEESLFGWIVALSANVLNFSPASENIILLSLRIWYGLKV